MITDWKEIGSGTHNIVYINKDRTRVLKLRKRLKNIADDPQRSVRIWNEINSNIQDKAEIFNFETKTAWTCPFINGVQATDTEISFALIDIYSKKRRIVVDAIARENFIKSKDGKIICVDIGMALKLTETPDNESKTEHVERKFSQDSCETWKRKKSFYTPFFAEQKDSYPQAVKTIQALLYLDSKILNFDVRFLMQRFDLIELFAKAYDHQLQNSSHAPVAKKDEPQENIDIKDICKNILESYIHSRGNINKATNMFSPSIVTRFFRNQLITMLKVKMAQELLNKVDTLPLESLHGELLKNFSDPINTYGIFTNGFSQSILRCIEHINSKEEPNEKLKRD